MSAGDEVVQATFWLLDAPDSLATQSHHNADGTGVGSFGQDGAPRVEKEPIAAFEDRLFVAEARDVWSRTYVCHVRHATTGGVTFANTHPFCQRDRLFAHNGVIGNLPKLEERLGEELALVVGESDSERFFALITREIARHGGNVEAGICAAVEWVVQTLPVLSINFVLVTQTDLWALRYPETNTLFVLERAAGGSGSSAQALEQTSSHGMCVHCEPARDHPVAIVASERMDDDDGWRELHSGELVHIGPSLKLETKLLLHTPPPHAM
jgi:glutamine amidotransferase